jgi:hypothetical protein
MRVDEKTNLSGYSVACVVVSNNLLYDVLQYGKSKRSVNMKFSSQWHFREFQDVCLLITNYTRKVAQHLTSVLERFCRQFTGC